VRDGEVRFVSTGTRQSIDTRDGAPDRRGPRVVVGRSLVVAAARPLSRRAGDRGTTTRAAAAMHEAAYRFA
jgi:hypothetical protein